MTAGRLIFFRHPLYSEKIMDEQAGRVLKELIMDRGRSVIRDPKACEKLVLGTLPADSLESLLLRRALRERIPQELLDIRVPIQLQVPRLARRLERVSAVRLDVARWAVETWAYALGIEVPK
jgi:hypothetical protein